MLQPSCIAGPLAESLTNFSIPMTSKAIMAGRLMRELSARGGLKRCLIDCPGKLARNADV